MLKVKRVQNRITLLVSVPALAKEFDIVSDISLGMIFGAYLKIFYLMFYLACTMTFYLT